MKILVAIDDELFAQAITDFLGNQIWSTDTVFRLVHVTEPLRGVDAWPEVRYLDKDIDSTKKLLEESAELIQKVAGASKPSCALLFGDPAEEVLAECKRWKADLLIIGSHGRGFIARTLLGSVSHWLMNHAVCSVLVVRLPVQKMDELRKEQESKKKSKLPLNV